MWGRPGQVRRCGAQWSCGEEKRVRDIVVDVNVDISALYISHTLAQTLHFGRKHILWILQRQGRHLHGSGSTFQRTNSAAFGHIV